MINLSKLAKGQKLYFIGASGIEPCEVYIPFVYMSTPIMYENEPPAYFYSAARAVVLLPDSFTKILTSSDAKHFFYSRKDAEAVLQSIFDTMKFREKEKSNERSLHSHESKSDGTKANNEKAA
jgi:hypothetical protein